MLRGLLLLPLPQISHVAHNALFQFVAQKLTRPLNVMHVKTVKASNSNTVLMVIMLVGCVGGVFVLFALMALCYR